MTQQTVRVVNQLGLHARAAAKLVEIAKTYAAAITLARTDEPNPKPVDAKSIMSVMLLAAPLDTELLLSAEGDDEEEAASAIVHLFADRFGEEQ